MIQGDSLRIMRELWRGATIGQEAPFEEAAMTGAVFQPELIELMRSVLEDVTATLPEAKRTSTIKADIASNILACAAKGERDPAVLRSAALSAVIDCTRYSHDVSQERRAV